jgi:hypothetical protein
MVYVLLGSVNSGLRVGSLQKDRLPPLSVLRKQARGKFVQSCKASYSKEKGGGKNKQESDRL